MYFDFSRQKAAMDGNNLIACMTTPFSLNQQKFVVNPAVHGEKGRKIKSWLNKFEMDLPEDAYCYQAVPNVDYKK